MSDPRLGAFVLQHRYRLAGGTFDEYLTLIAVVRAWLIELGVAHFEVWRNPDDPREVTEIQAYDSWSHYMRVNGKQVPPKVKEVYHDMEQLLDGGFASVQTTTWQPTEIPHWDGMV